MNQTRSLLLKLLAIAGLTLVVLIALYQVESVIADRQNYRDQATRSIAEGYASAQRVTGPVFVQPYRQTTERTVTDRGVPHTEAHVEESTLTIFPSDLEVAGALKPSLRRRGLYTVPVYEFDGTVRAHFQVPESRLPGKIEYGAPYLAFRIKDPRGIIGRPTAQINGTDYPVEGGSLTTLEADTGVNPPIASGTNLRVLIPAAAGKSGGFDLALRMALGGTQQLEIVPLADTNHFDLASSWPNPLFAGQFLPRSRELSTGGFHAQWDISSLASATQQQMLTKADGATDAISISLANTLDAYTLADRAVKYGILFVLITFGGFFLFELAKRMLIHPVQYLLVGACLAIFFLLLVSFSEHLPFALAYLISSLACIGLLTYYLVFVLHSREYGLGFGAMLATLYAAIYGLLISEDNALLLGSLLLFALLSVVMILTRKVDWYQKTSDLTGSASPPQILSPQQ